MTKMSYLIAVRMCADQKEESKLDKKDLEINTNNNTYRNN